MVTETRSDDASIASLFPTSVAGTRRVPQPADGTRRVAATELGDLFFGREYRKIAGWEEAQFPAGQLV
jgi:hypothetical protein